MAIRTDVLLFADYFCDVIITGLPEPPRLGADLFGQALEIAPGGVYILAHWLHSLGVGVRWAARFGNDIFSRFILEEAARTGLDPSLFQVYPVPYRVLSFSFSFAHDRGFISYNDPAPGEIDHAGLIRSQQPRWVVNSPFDDAPGSRALMDLVHQQGGRVFIDCQYTTASLADPGLAETLSKVDIFAPNLSEASQLTAETEPLAALARLADFCPLVVLKCGAQGAYARRGGQVWHSPALQVDVIDTTGAGDSFNAGFLAGLLAALLERPAMQNAARADQLLLDSDDVQHILGRAVASASLCVMQTGCVPPSRDQVVERVATLRPMFRSL